MTQFTVVYDACVLYPAALRDFLMHLAITNPFRARWTDMIHDEWIRDVLEDRPDLEALQLDRTRQLMDANVLISVPISNDWNRNRDTGSISRAVRAVLSQN